MGPSRAAAPVVRLLTRPPVALAPFHRQVATLSPEEPLPEELMQRFYYSPYALLRSGRYADRIAPFLRHFKREK